MRCVTVRPNTYIYLALLLLFVPLPWLCGWIVAILFHEFGHWAAVRLCGGRILQLSVGVGGLAMKTDTLSEGKRLISTLCGPLVGLLPVLLGRYLPRASLCSWLLTVYNLLPILPLDGGHALQIIMKDSRSFVIVEKIFLFIITIAAVFLAFFAGFGILPIIIVFVLWVRNGKTPCNKVTFKVQ